MRAVLEYLAPLVDTITSEGIYPEIGTVSGSSTDPEIVVNGKCVLLFCSPNYLGLANHPEVKTAAKEAIDFYGAGTVGSGLISGYLEAHRNLERAIAEFMETEAAIFFNSVTLTNMGVVTAVMDPPLRAAFPHLLSGRLGKRVIIGDEENHASIWDAVKLTRVEKTLVYRHNDMNQLESLLQLCRKRGFDHILIVTDGYFSMSADTAPLNDIVRLAEQYKAMVAVDDAHASFVLGLNGRGTAELYGVEKMIDFPIGSLAKAIGVRGGFTCGGARFIKYLRVSARGYVFSGTLPASIPAAILAALAIAQREPWRRKKVLENAAYLRKGLQSLGYQVLGEGHIVPWMIGPEDKAAAVAHGLFEAGIFAPCIRTPAVKEGQARIRFIPMATHEKEHLDRVLEACQAVGQHYSVSTMESVT